MKKCGHPADYKCACNGRELKSGTRVKRLDQEFESPAGNRMVVAQLMRQREDIGAIG